MSETIEYLNFFLKPSMASWPQNRLEIFLFCRNHFVLELLIGREISVQPIRRAVSYACVVSPLNQAERGEQGRRACITEQQRSIYDKIYQII